MSVVSGGGLGVHDHMGFVDGDVQIGGQKIVEIDKAYIGGKDRMGYDDRCPRRSASAECE